MTDVWLTEDLPFLRIVRGLEDQAEPGELISLSQNMLIFDLEHGKGLKIGLRLHAAGYLSGEPLETASGVHDFYVTGLTERGRRAVGQWPSDDPWANLVDLLSRQIEQEPDPDKRGRLVKIRDGVLAAGREISTSLLTTYLTQQAGMG